MRLSELEFRERTWPWGKKRENEFGEERRRALLKIMIKTPFSKEMMGSFRIFSSRALLIINEEKRNK